MTFGGLVLAAGSGSRFGGPKAPFIVDGERLVDRAVRCLTEAGCAPVLVVLGAWVGRVPGAQVIVNTAWENGMGSSLRTGLEAARTFEMDGLIITLVDLPGQSAEGARLVANAEGELVVATYEGKRGHPVRIGRQYWPAVAELARGDSGARRFFEGRDDVVTVEVGDVASADDLDVRPDDRSPRAR